MKTFGLTAKNSNEIISKTNVETLEEAKTYFAKTKKLKKVLLLQIFEIKEIN
jgi:hypothetical protein